MQRWPFLVPVVLCVSLARAATENGNTLALDFSTASPARQQEIRKEAEGRLFFFRYLLIIKKERATDDSPTAVRMETMEPSSDMRVVFTVRKKVSLEKAAALNEADAVALTGRIKHIGEPPGTIVLDPVVIRYKDRPVPKVGKELLHELDPEARRGTDTSSGKEEVLK